MCATKAAKRIRASIPVHSERLKVLDRWWSEGFDPLYSRVPKLDDLVHGWLARRRESDDGWGGQNQSTLGVEHRLPRVGGREANGLCPREMAVAIEKRMETLP